MRREQFITDLMARGRYTFTSGEAVTYFGTSVVTTRAAIRRLVADGKVAIPSRGFHVIVPPAYREIGCLPPDQFIPDLFRFWGAPYYVALLSAAEFHGAAHQRPQRFQVMTGKSRADIQCGKVHVEFILKKKIESVPLVMLNTPRGSLRVSSPEATALDIFSYQSRVGGIALAFAVLEELADALDPRLLADAAADRDMLPAAQRVGYLLELLEKNDKTALLYDAVAGRITYAVPLAQALPVRGAPTDRRWKVRLNDDISVIG